MQGTGWGCRGRFGEMVLRLWASLNELCMVMQIYIFFIMNFGSPGKVTVYYRLISSRPLERYPVLV